MVGEMTEPRTTTRQTAGTSGPALSPALLVTAIFLAALNLRAALASVPPLVHTIQDDLGLSSAAAGLLTTVPVLCMGLFAPVSQRLAHRVGREMTVAIALGLLVVGLLLRLGGGAYPVLLVSTLLPGIGIALCGTVLPGIVKEFFPGRSGVMTGVYLLAMMIGATAASALAVPLADALGSWERSLAVWSALAVVGLVGWLPVVRRVNDRDEPTDPAGQLHDAPQGQKQPGVAGRPAARLVRRRDPSELGVEAERLQRHERRHQPSRGGPPRESDPRRR